jgi:hypothetical protein
MDTKRMILQILGGAAGGGLMYLAVRRTPRSTRTLATTVVEGGAITGGFLLGYHLAGFAANRFVSEQIEALPEDQATSLPSGDVSVATPTADQAMGAVAKNAAAVTPVATSRDVAQGGGQVIDITKMRQES